MERGKMSSSGRGGKSKAPQHPQDIFALGSKSTVSRDAEKRNIHKPSTSGVERKREASTFGAPPPTKKSRIGSPAEAVGGTSLEIDPVDLVPNVLQALDTHNSDKLLCLLTGSIRLLKSQRSKPDPILCMSMLYLTKIRPNMFAHDTVTQSLCTLLKREQGAAFKNKGNPLVFVLACNMLYAGHRENTNWPDTFIKVYIEDALNERWWVECSWCKCLVDNIVTAFNTKQPPSHLIPTDSTLGTMSPSGSGSPLMGSNDDDVDVSEIEYAVYPRYSTSYESVEGLVLEAIKDQIQRRTAPDAIGKGFLKLLSATCGFPEIRMIAASRLEAWLHSGKLWRCAQQLLAHVCVNAAAAGPSAARDHEVLAQLARLRLKTKPLQQAYLNCVREMVSSSGALLRSVVTHTVYNELSNVRSPNNMLVLSALLQAQPQLAPQALADTFLELVGRAEDYLRPLRALTRECVRGAGRGDAQALLPLARGLANPPHHEPPAEIRERAFNSLVDLFCTCCLVTASHRAHLTDARAQLTLIQATALGWLLDCAPLYRAHAHQVTTALHKIMFLEPAESYSKVDNWPPESERALTYRVCCEAPLPQTTLLRIIYIGLAKQLPIGPAEVLELVEQLVRRACALPSEDNPLLVDQLEVADYIFQLCQFHPPDNITLPAGYTPPPLAITSLYWRGWMVLCMIAAHNPQGFAERAAAQYPTLRALIETCITGKPSIEWMTSGTEAERLEAEKAAILQLETHLAAASNAKLPISEASSRLLSQLTSLEPLGPARRPPTTVIEAVISLSTTLRLARLLARQPSLLLALVQRHGTRRAMPWLTQLLRHEKARLSVLPVQCLCEFLSAGGVDRSAGGGGGLAAHVRRTAHESRQGAHAVLTYYLQRLAHTNQQGRRAARRGLKLVLSPTIDENAEMDYNTDVSPEEWLEHLPSLRHWDAVCSTAGSRLLAACVCETEPDHVAAYLAFLPQILPATPAAVLELSQILMERSTVMGHVLSGTSNATERQHRALHAVTTILYTHIRKVYLEGEEASPPPSEGSPALETVPLQWGGGRCATLPLTVAHAHLKLLCYPPSMYDTNQEMYNFLESIWIGNDAPQVISPSGSGPDAPDILLPDWLRLQLVRSGRPALLQAALAGLPANKLALFIQTFGMPVPAMSALLCALDACPARAVCRVGVERAYMRQLLRVQRARGARGGHAFAHALGLTHTDTEPPDDTLFVEQPLPPEPASVWDEFEPETPPTIELDVVPSLLATVFNSASNFKGDADLAFTQLIAMITSEMCDTQQSCPFAVLSAQWLQQNCACAARRPTRAAALMRAISPSYQLIEPLARQFKCVPGVISSLLRTGQKTSKASEVDVDIKPGANVEQIIAAFETATPGTLEAIGHRIISSQESQPVADAISQLLLYSQQGKYDQLLKCEEGESVTPHVLSNLGRGCGLLLDWLLDLQKESLAHSHTQMRLMFVPVGTGAAGARAQLAALLPPRAAPRTLQACLTPASEWSPTAVLDFAETMLGGSGSTGGKRDRTPQDILRLSHAQVKVLIEYIEKESSQLEASEGDVAALERMQRRVPLLLRCCSGSALALLLMQPRLRYLLHMQIPKLIKLDDDFEVPDDACANISSAADTVAHALLTANHSNKWWRMEAAWGALVRRARTAGRRAVPLVGALLRGTTQRHQPRQHHALLHALIVPRASTHHAHSAEIHSILDSFLSTMKGGRDSGAQHRVAAILRRYLALKPSAGQALLRQHRDTVASIPALASLSNMEPPSSSYPPENALLVLQRRSDPPHELAQALQELDAWGTRRGGGWGGTKCARRLLAAAAPLAASDHAACRNAALQLLPKLLPAVSDTTPGLLAVLECLDSDLPEVTAAILDKLPDILVGMPEQASRVLARVFELGVTSRQPVEQCITKCVLTFNQQRGC